MNECCPHCRAALAASHVFVRSGTRSEQFTCGTERLSSLQDGAWIESGSIRGLACQQATGVPPLDFSKSTVSPLGRRTRYPSYEHAVRSGNLVDDAGRDVS